MCDKCDDRYIHYKSPQSKDYKEECSCSTQYYKYIPDASKICKDNTNDTIQLLANIATFTMKYNVSPCEEYTNNEARDAVEEIINRHLDWLHITL